MTKKELREFRKWWNENRSVLSVRIAIKDVDDFISLNSKALDKIPNVIDNEDKKNKITKYCTWCEEKTEHRIIHACKKCEPHA